MLPTSIILSLYILLLLLPSHGVIPDAVFTAYCAITHLHHVQYLTLKYYYLFQ